MANVVPLKKTAQARDNDDLIRRLRGAAPVVVTPAEAAADPTNPNVRK
jgi:hypothetical protein